jgi:hypothetical protein
MRYGFEMAVAALAAALYARAGAAQVAPTLTGEELSGIPEVTPECRPDGTSTVTFTVSGTAAGPYPGTFTETGTATIGPQTVDLQAGNSLGTLLTFDAVFTIHSPAGEVSGTKTLSLPLTNPAREVAIGQCNTFGPGNLVQLVDVVDRFTVRYEAHLATPLGEFSDRGLVPVVAVQQERAFEDPIRMIFQFFVEDFASDLTTAEPLTSPGHATGGGRVAPDATFAFTAKSDERGVKGSCTVIDRATNTTVRCLDATTYFQAGAHASFGGSALVNGAPTTYRIAVDDQGEPGTADTFTLTTATGYTVAGVLTEGNVQVHR